jgi:hypothetical protein
LQLHDNDIPGEPTPTQRFEFRKSVVLGILAVVFGAVLLVIGLIDQRNIVIPATAIVGGLLLLVFDYRSARARRRKVIAARCVLCSNQTLA